MSLVGKALKLLDGQFYRVPDTLTPDERFDALHIRLYAAEVTLAVGRAMLGRTTSDFAKKVAKFESLLKKNAPTRPADTIALSLRAA